MKCLAFDSSSLISIVTNDLLWVLGVLKERFDGEFFIPSSVKKEIVDYPIKTNRFKFEAIRIESFIEQGVLKLGKMIDVTDLLHVANKIYSAEGEPIKIVHYGEMEAIALAVQNGCNAVVIDERTMRWLVEDPEALRQLLEKKLHTKVQMNAELARRFRDFTRGVKIIRSTELIMIAYELGLLDEFVTKEFGSKELIDGILWGLRLKGCAISTEEINDLVRMEGR